MNLIDTHCHIAMSAFDEDREQVLARMREAGLVNAVVIADPAEEHSVENVRNLCETNDFLYWAAGVHPEHADHWNAEAEATVRAALAHPKCVALGEIGLDYYWEENPPREVQRQAFTAQLRIAHALNKAAVLHIREAHGDNTDILLRAHAEGWLPQVILHCYSGSWESAKTYLKLGAYISFTGTVTFKNAAKVQEVARQMPADRLLVETDCPFMAPVPMRGKRNEPAFVAYTLTKIAELRGVGPDRMADIATENARRAFSLPRSRA